MVLAEREDLHSLFDGIETPNHITRLTTPPHRAVRADAETIGSGIYEGDSVLAQNPAVGPDPNDLVRKLHVTHISPASSNLIPCGQLSSAKSRKVILPDVVIRTIRAWVCWVIQSAPSGLAVISWVFPALPGISNSMTRPS